MKAVSSKYFKTILLLTILLFLWQPAWGLVKTATPDDPFQGQGDYFVNFNMYVDGATGKLGFAIDPLDSSWAVLNTDGTLTVASVDHPLNSDVGSQVTITVTDKGNPASDPASVDFVLTVQNVNDAPVFVDSTGAPLTAIEPLSATEEAPFTYELIVQDVDIPLGVGESLESSLSDNAPSWLKIAAGTPDAKGKATITLSGTPDEELSLGGDLTYSDLSVSVRDSSMARVVSPLFSLTVAPVDDPPTITGTAILNAKQGDLYSFKPVYADPDTTDLTYTLTIGDPPAEPAAEFWLQIKNDGTISGTPKNTDVAPANNPVSNVIISVSDATTTVDFAAFDITVENTNDAPAIDLITCTLPACTNPPAPDESVAQVVELPQATAAQGDAYLIELNVSDIDIIDQGIEINAQSPADILYSFISAEGGLPDWIEMFYPDETDHRIMQLRNKANRPNNNDVGKYNDIQVVVTDGMGGVAKTALFSITVENSNDTPFFTQTPISVVSVNEDDPVLFTPTGSAVTDTTTKVKTVIADDIDLKYGDSLEYSFDFSGVTTSNANALDTWLGIDSATGEFTGVPRAINVGTYRDIKIIATDSGALFDEYTFDLTVKAVNDLPVFTQAPPQDIIIEINAGIAFPSGYSDIKATDEDSTDSPADFVTFKLKDGAPAWLSIVNIGKDAETETFLGKLKGTPTNADSGEAVSVTIIAEDNSGSTQMPEWTFQVKVNYVNKAPVIDGSITLATQTWDEDSYKEIIVPVTDDAGDTITPELSTNAPAWLSYRMDGLNVILSGTPQARDIGVTNSIALTVTDASNASDSKTFNLEVKAVNDAPVISGSLPLGEINKAYSFTPSVSDEEGNEITFGIKNNPSWLSINPLTGELSGTPKEAGNFNITITAYDSLGATDELTAALKVIDPATDIAKGDVDASGVVDLADAIIVLQIMADISPASSIALQADTNGDGKMGIEDVIYIMNNITVP